MVDEKNKKIRVAIAGVGNCACSLIQGIEYYKNAEGNDFVPGLMHTELGRYKVRDVKPVMGIDIDERKVGKDLSEAIFAKPNCTKVFCKNIPKLNAPVYMGNVLDGVAQHMLEHPNKDETFVIAKQKEATKEEIIKKLKENKVDILVNYMPVGSQKATEFYAQCALEAGCAFINAMPIFIASDENWIKKFEDAKLPCLGDDIKSQFGATFSHRNLVQGYVDRGVVIEWTSQENFGGNTDFLNMSDSGRVQSKLKSKHSSISSLVPYKLPHLYAGPGLGANKTGHGYVREQLDNKTATIKVHGRGFGDIPIEVELNISCEDSPNSAGIIIDAIRCAKIALDRKVYGAITSPSSYFFKHPYEKITDAEAKTRMQEFIEGKRER